MIGDAARSSSTRYRGRRRPQTLRPRFHALPLWRPRDSICGRHTPDRGAHGVGRMAAPAGGVRSSRRPIRDQPSRKRAVLEHRSSCRGDLPDDAHIVYGANGRLNLRRLDQTSCNANPRHGRRTDVNRWNQHEILSSRRMASAIGFWQNGQLKKVSVTGGAAVVLCPRTIRGEQAGVPTTPSCSDRARRASCG